jgi:hypothetical protein
MAGKYEATDKFGLRIASKTTAERNASTTATYTIIDKDVTDPSTIIGPSPGDKYIVAVGAIGVWAGQDNNIANWNGSSWDFIVSTSQLVVFVTDEDITYAFSGGAWNTLTGQVVFDTDLLIRVYFDGKNWLQQYDTVMNKLDATAAPTANDDANDGFEVGSHWVDVSADNAYVCVDATVASAVWVQTGSSGASAPQENLLGGSDLDYARTFSASYETLATMHFAGSTIRGTPSKMKVVAHKTSTITSYNIKIVDITNANTIVESTGNTDTVPSIVDLGALSSIPAGEAIFEIQAHRVGGSGGTDVRLYAFTIEF